MGSFLSKALLISPLGILAEEALFSSSSLSLFLEAKDCIGEKGPVVRLLKTPFSNLNRTLSSPPLRCLAIINSACFSVGVASVSSQVPNP